MAGQRNMASLEALKRLLDNPQRIMETVSRSMAEEAIGLIKDGFRTETDPYGKKWAKRQRETRSTSGRKVLSGQTSRLKNGWKIRRADGAEISISPSVDYAEPHQNPKPKADGSGLKRPRRMMVPDEQLGLPPKWERDLNETANEAFATIFGGDGRRVAGLRRRLQLDAFVGFKVA